MPRAAFSEPSPSQPDSNDLHLNVSGDCVVQNLLLHVPWTDTVNDLHRLLGAELSIPTELLRVDWNFPGLASVPSGDQPLWLIALDNHSGQHDITCERIEAPLHHDGVSYCDSCKLLRHVCHGYVDTAPGQWDAFAATCVPCGGMKTRPWKFTESGISNTSPMFHLDMIKI